jgi:hypothetical protein
LFLAGGGEGNHFKKKNTRTFHSHIFLRKKIAFFQSLIYLGERKYAVLIPSSHPIPPKGVKIEKTKKS